MHVRRRCNNSSAIGDEWIGRLSFTDLLTSVIGILIALYHFRIGFVLFPLVVFILVQLRVIYSEELSVPWRVTTSWLFLFVVCSAGCMFTRRRLISSFLMLSIPVFPAAFLRHLIAVFANIILPLLVMIEFSVWYRSVGVNTAFMIWVLVVTCAEQHGHSWVLARKCR